MCGFVGCTFASKEVLEKLAFTLKDRAIDSDTYYYDEGLSIYHAHLKISDLDKETTQPYVYKDLVISLVGEIYNKDFLVQLCGALGTGEDYTELQVIGLCFEKMGENFINYVNGEFAIFIYNKEKKEYYLFRDRYGVNLLYYRINNGNLYFGSEMKSLFLTSPEVSEKGFIDYMIFQFSISPNTIVKDIYSLEPGCYIKYVDSHLIIKKLEEYQYQTTPESMIHAVCDAVKRRIPKYQNKILVSLSGGPDSNLITHTLANNFAGEIIAYSFLTSTNEREIEYAMKNTKTLGIKHLILDIDTLSKSDDFFSDYGVHEGLVNLPNILKILKNQYPEYRDVKVAFAGDGKEELLMMNTHYPYGEIIPRYKFFREKYNIDYDITHEFLNLTLFDFNLQLYDKVSLRNGVEVRLPFTDYELIRFYKYAPYRADVTRYLETFGIDIVKEEYGYGLGLKFSYFYDKELVERKKILFAQFTNIFQEMSKS